MLGPDGRPEPPKPDERSEPQRWLSIAAKDDLLADALTYFARGDDWFDVYKALECLEMRFGGAKRGQAERFRRLGWADKARSSCSSGPQTQDDMQERSLTAASPDGADGSARPAGEADGSRVS